MQGMKTGGRQAGTPNKVTAQAREAFQLLLDANVAKLQEWIDATAKTDPSRAFDMVMDVASHVVPKLKSIEMNDADPSMGIPILTAFDGVVHIPKDWPGNIIHIKTPDFTGTPLVAYVGPEGAGSTAVSGPTSAANTE